MLWVQHSPSYEGSSSAINFLLSFSHSRPRPKDVPWCCLLLSELEHLLAGNFSQVTSSFTHTAPGSSLDCEQVGMGKGKKNAISPGPNGMVGSSAGTTGFCKYLKLVRTHDCHIAINLFTYSRKGEKLVKEVEFPSSF